jgi:hypothetical protein
MQAEITDPVSLPPAIQGSHGKAWRLDLDKHREAFRTPPSTVAMWIIEAGFAHPFWHSYVVSLCDLADRPGVEPATRYIENATHELVIYALDPKMVREDFLLNKSPVIMVMEPCNFAAQMSGEKDDTATKRVEDAVRMVCDGHLSPDTDFRSQWVALFGDSMLKKFDQSAALHSLEFSETPTIKDKVH